MRGGVGRVHTGLQVSYHPCEHFAWWSERDTIRLSSNSLSFPRLLSSVRTATPNPLPGCQENVRNAALSFNPTRLIRYPQE